MAKKKAEKTVSSVMGVPTRNFEGYLKFFNKNGLKELTIKERGTVISLKRDDQQVMVQQVAVQSAAAVAAPAAASVPQVQKSQAVAEDTDSKYEKIASPIIGTFYVAPSPDSPPFVKEGQTVEKGETFCIVEAMKVMNKITAEFRCKIVARKKENAEGVKSGETLFLVEKA